LEGGNLKVNDWRMNHSVELLRIEDQDFSFGFPGWLAISQSVMSYFAGLFMVEFYSLLPAKFHVYDALATFAVDCLTFERSTF
jgi:hypothetical protein